MDSNCKNVVMTAQGGDPHNQTPLFDQPGWTWTWQSPPQPQEPVQICRYGRGKKFWSQIGLQRCLSLITFPFYIVLLRALATCPAQRKRN